MKSCVKSERCRDREGACGDLRFLKGQSHRALEGETGEDCEWSGRGERGGGEERVTYGIKSTTGRREEAG